MRILITGYTTRMFGSDRVRGDYITFSYLLEDILKEMGHQVERRKVRIGEEINHVYDYAFCGVAPLNSMTSGKVPETHYVIDSMPDRHCVYADDWSFCGFGGSVRYTLNTWGKYLDYKKFPYSAHELEETRQSLELMMKFDRFSNGPVLCPMFTWGDHDVLMKDNYEAVLWDVDPSAWLKFPTIKTFAPEIKNRAWVMAALSDHSRWVNKQKLTLPVEYIGNKKFSNGRYFSEDQTVQYFAQNWGVLACEYPSAGSGWWRTRYHNAAWAETLVYAPKLDTEHMGYAYKWLPQYYESLSSKEYTEMAQSQNRWLQHNTPPKEQVMARLERLMKI